MSPDHSIGIEFCVPLGAGLIGGAWMLDGQGLLSANSGLQGTATEVDCGEAGLRVARPISPPRVPPRPGAQP